MPEQKVQSRHKVLGGSERHRTAYSRVRDGTPVWILEETRRRGDGGVAAVRSLQDSWTVYRLCIKISRHKYSETNCLGRHDQKTTKTSSYYLSTYGSNSPERQTGAVLLGA